MPNNESTSFVVSDNTQSAGANVVNPSAAYTVGPEDNFVICGGNSIAITLDANSNSPVHISSIDGTTQRTGCTIVANGNSYQIEDGGSTATCTRVAQGSLWVVVGAQGIA